jgi:adenylate cyclase
MVTPPDTDAAAARRELAAIMFSDIASYTTIMGRDEQEGLDARNSHRELLRTILPRFNGRLLGDLGDGALSSFHSAIDAVNCARALQAATGNNAQFRIRVGIHVGDVLFSDNTVLGDGVNVASRIVALAEPGRICISERVYEEIRNQRGMVVRSLGNKSLKNVSRPIGVYVLSEGPDSSAAARSPARTSRMTRGVALAGVGAIAVAALAYVAVTRHAPAPNSVTPLGSGPHVIRSIAVLPLDNYSGDPKQEYFADGMTDELTTDLATISQLRVISRGSVMQFKGEHRPPTPQIARLLNVDAVVEGSVLRVGDKVRITAQLIDAPADKHMWAKSYERDSKRRSGWIQILRQRIRDCLTPMYGPASMKQSLPPRKRCPRLRRRQRKPSNWTTIRPKRTPRLPYSNGSTNMIGQAARGNFSAHSHSIQTTRSLTISSVGRLPYRDGWTKGWPRASARLN